MKRTDMRVRISTRFVSDDDLIADMSRVAALAGSCVLTRAQYARSGNYHPTTIHRRLGGWTAACEKAGLESGRSDLGRRDEEWMENIYDAWIKQGRQPSYGDMRGSRFTPEGYARRYGSWTSALLAFQDWLDRTERDGVLEPSASQERSYGRTPSLRLRFNVLQRDRFTCVGCGTSPAIEPGTVLHVDHIVPFSKGGRTESDNLQTLCARCNLGKADSLR
jgi:hypothetical protein